VKRDSWGEEILVLLEAKQVFLHSKPVYPATEGSLKNRMSKYEHLS